MSGARCAVRLRAWRAAKSSAELRDEPQELRRQLLRPAPVLGQRLQCIVQISAAMGPAPFGELDLPVVMIDGIHSRDRVILVRWASTPRTAVLGDVAPISTSSCFMHISG